MSDDEHDHDADAARPAIVAGEQITLVSAGIDIGSATSHLLVSELELRRQGVALSSGYTVVRRQIRYRSPVLLTPYSAPDTIDADELRQFIDRSYADAGVDAETIDTGAVIVTGEAARKHNAEAITHLFAAHGGKFVCAVAGPLLEARLAVQGSGAARLSRERSQQPVLSLDIGGGTTKVSLLLAGEVQRVVVINVGARLLAWNAAGQLERTEHAGQLALEQAAPLRANDAPIDDTAATAVAEWLADRLFGALSGTPGGALADELLVAGTPFTPPDGCAIVVSGGVGEYVYGALDASFGDLGPHLGRAVRARIAASGRAWELVPAAHCLRSTAIGASQFTVQVSGNTIFMTDPGRLPLRNLAVVHVRLPCSEPIAEDVEAAVVAALALADDPERDAPMVLALHGRVIASYPCLRSVCSGLAAAHRSRGGGALVVVLDQDVAGLVGNLLHRELGLTDVLCVDQVAVNGLDYIDIGTVLPEARAVPVMAKSLLFGAG